LQQQQPGQQQGGQQQSQQQHQQLMQMMQMRERLFKFLIVQCSTKLISVIDPVKEAKNRISEF
jgi:hypothetical protein